MVSANPTCIICDLDGTLALIDHRDPYDATLCELDSLNHPVAAVLERFANDTDIVLVSGRIDTWRTETERWLETHCIPYTKLYMRRAGDRRKDTVLKKEIFERHISPQWEVRFVLEDRNQVVVMWRELGLVCFQVAPGDF
ncbi:MAG TPA: hypothetical protein VD999_04065 [Vitreimonas sp.]|nr:hypothetical protein [Vitreimonas sp.]